MSLVFYTQLVTCYKEIDDEIFYSVMMEHLQAINTRHSVL